MGLAHALPNYRGDNVAIENVPTVTAGPPTDNQSPLQLHFRAEESGNEVRDVAGEDGDTDANQNPGCQVDGKYRTKVSILV